MKAKGIHGLSHILIDKHNGLVPQTHEDLEELPAVGHKTAAVVRCHVSIRYSSISRRHHIHRIDVPLEPHER
jgi:endonuclease-3